MQTCIRDLEEASGKTRPPVAQIGTAHAYLKTHKLKKKHLSYFRVPVHIWFSAYVASDFSASRYRWRWSLLAQSSVTTVEMAVAGTLYSSVHTVEVVITGTVHTNSSLPTVAVDIIDTVFSSVPAVRWSLLALYKVVFPRWRLPLLALYTIVSPW